MGAYFAVTATDETLAEMLGEVEGTADCSAVEYAPGKFIVRSFAPHCEPSRYQAECSRVIDEAAKRDSTIEHLFDGAGFLADLYIDETELPGH